MRQVPKKDIKRKWFSKTMVVSVAQKLRKEGYKAKVKPIFLKRKQWETDNKKRYKIITNKRFKK